MTNDQEMPLCFDKALAQNYEALNKFAQLNEKQKNEIISSSTPIRSNDDLKNLINKIAADY